MNQENNNNQEGTINKIKGFSIQICMALLPINEEFKEDFLKIAADIYADVISYSSNANCSCRSKVWSWIMKNTKITKDLLIEFYSKHPEIIDPLIVDIMQARQINKMPTVEIIHNEDIKGKSFIIDANNTAYEKFMLDIKSKNYNYKGLQVIPQNDKWIILFY